MAGLLDLFNNISPEQNQGLLAAAAQILQNSGPGRPFSIGQALGTGVGAYQQFKSEAEQKKQAKAQNDMMAKLTGLKIKDAESDLANQEAARSRATSLQQALRDFHGGQATPMPAPQSASAMVQGMASGQMPQEAPTQPTASSPRVSAFEKRMAEAEYLRSKGFGTEAAAAEEAALKLRPKVSSWKEVREGGKVLYAPYFDDGSSGQPVPLEVAEKLHFANLGNKTVGVNPYTGAQAVSYNNAMSPDSAASNSLARERLNFDKSQVGKPVFNADVGGFVLPPSKANPSGSVIPLAGGAIAPKLTEDQAKATGWLVQAENAWKNMKAVGVSKDGKPTDAAKPGVADAVANFPFGLMEPVGNTFRTPARQKFVQASSSLSEALLRAATGAGVTKEEAIQKVRELTPVFGEDDATTQQKMESIPLFIDSLKARAGKGAGLAADVFKKNAKPQANGWSITKVDD